MTTQATTIQVQYVNQPKPGKRAGSIKDMNGQYWTVAPEDLPRFAPNQTAEILYDDHGNYQMVVGMGGQLFPKTPRPPQAGSAVPPQSGTAAQVWKAPLAPKPAQNAPQLTYDTKEEGMFVMGVVGRAMGSGKFEIEQIPELAKVASTAWRQRHEQPVMETGSPAHQARSDIDTQYGGTHPEAPPMNDPNDPGWP